MTTAKEPQAERMMTAAVLTRPERFELSQVPRPPCPAGGLLLRVSACAVCGSDVRLFRGQKQIKGSQEIAGQVLPGHVIGHEIVGVIEEAGSPGAEYRPGELVVVAPGIACGTCDNRRFPLKQHRPAGIPTGRCGFRDLRRPTLWIRRLRRLRRFHEETGLK